MFGWFRRRRREGSKQGVRVPRSRGVAEGIVWPIPTPEPVGLDLLNPAHPLSPFNQPTYHPVVPETNVVQPAPSGGSYCDSTPSYSPSPSYDSSPAPLCDTGAGSGS